MTDIGKGDWVEAVIDHNLLHKGHVYFVEQLHEAPHYNEFGEVYCLFCEGIGTTRLQVTGVTDGLALGPWDHPCICAFRPSASRPSPPPPPTPNSRNPHDRP